MVERGHALEAVLAMGLPEFDSLWDSCQRLQARANIEAAWTNFVTAQTSGKDVEKWVSQWKAALEIEKPKEGTLNDFLKRYPHGF